MYAYAGPHLEKLIMLNLVVGLFVSRGTLLGSMAKPPHLGDYYVDPIFNIDSQKQWCLSLDHMVGPMSYLFLVRHAPSHLLELNNRLQKIALC